MVLLLVKMKAEKKASLLVAKMAHWKVVLMVAKMVYELADWKD
jgi:hypothetical protein